MKTWKTPAGDKYSFHTDLLEQQHLMIAGAKGTGKSVLLNGIVYNALYRAPGDMPGYVQFILIDPKRVELSMYKDLPHTIRYASEPADMIVAIQYAMNIADNRFKIMQKRREKLYTGGDVYILIDEFADLMTANGKAVKPLIQRIAQIGRAARVHIILCTQCPLVKIIPTEIKVNFDSIIGLHTASRQHSRNIIDAAGCEELPQWGECYYTKPGAARIHCVNIPYFSDEVLEERVKWWTDQNKGFVKRLFCA